MRDTRSVAAPCGFVLTPFGREGLETAETCSCRPAIDGGLVVCLDCDTVYGLLSMLDDYSGRYLSRAKRD